MALNPTGLRFDGNSGSRQGQLHTAASLRGLSAFTWESWVKPDLGVNRGAWYRAYNEWQGIEGRPRFTFAPYYQTLRFEFAREDGTSDTHYNYPFEWDDRWHHVAFTCDIGNEAYQIYLDGAIVAEGRLVDGGLDAEDNALTVSDTAPLFIQIGRTRSKNTSTSQLYSWQGKIDDIRIWNRVQSQNDILTLMHDHVDLVTETNCLFNWRFNEGSGGSTNEARDTLLGSIDSGCWTSDRPFMGDGTTDTTAPSEPIANGRSDLTSTSFSWSWDAATDNVWVQDYEVQLSTTSDFSSAVEGYGALRVGREQAITFVNLTPATAHYHRVRALDAEDNASDWVTFNNNESITTLSAGDVTPPEAPTMLGATNVSHDRFTLNWGEATDDTAVTGYRIDIARDQDFSNFFLRNDDVGNTLTETKLGVAPLTSYWARVRAYDAAGNESADSNAVKITTTTPPDTTPPNIVSMLPAQAIKATEFRAAWNEGVDNVAVTGYYLDVATDSGFTEYLSGYEGLDVGNVTEYVVSEGIDPDTYYYYRTRAYDAAGNVSGNTSVPITVLTLPHSIIEGGLQTTQFPPTADGYVQEEFPTVSFGTSETLSVVGTAGVRMRAYLTFDCTDLVGTIDSGALRLYVSDPSVDTITVQGPLSTELTEGTDWNDLDAALTGPTVTFQPFTDEAWIDVDITPLLVNGAAVYSFAVWSEGDDALSFQSREDELDKPHLIVETDPISAVEQESITVVPRVIERRNFLPNPGAEGGLANIGGVAGDTRTQDDSNPHSGSFSVKIVTGGIASSEGVKFFSNDLNIAGGDTYYGSIALRADQTGTGLDVYIRVFYDDATFVSSPTITVDPPTSPDGWVVYDLGSVATDPAKTISTIEIQCFRSGMSVVTFWADSAIVSDGPGPWFSGSSPNAYWDDNPNDSTSRHFHIELDAETTYLGDGNDDATFAIEHAASVFDDWIEATSAVDRETKTVTATVTPDYLANVIFNPSFSIDTGSWFGSGATIERVVGDGTDPNDSQAIACAEVVTDGGSFYEGVYYRGGSSVLVSATQGEEWTFSVDLKQMAGGTDQYVLQLLEKNEAGTILTRQDHPITLSLDWERYEHTFTISQANTQFINPAIYTPDGSPIVGIFRMDRAQLTNGDYDTYVDGDEPDGEWQGDSYNSPSHHIIAFDAEHFVRATATDPDGEVGTNPIVASLVTTKVPDNALTVLDLTLTPLDEQIVAVASYQGDDDEDATVSAEWKRYDREDWRSLATAVDRQARTVTAIVTDLAPGTAYDVRFTFDDPQVVYGINPIARTTTTTTKRIESAEISRISFDGFVLQGREDRMIGVSSHNGFSMPSRRVQVEPLPRTDGAVELSRLWGERAIELTGFVSGRTRSELSANLRALRRALAPGQKRLVLDTLTNTQRYLLATCRDFRCPQDAERAFSLEWTADLVAPDPFFYDAVEQVTSFGVSDGGSVTLVNYGDLTTPPTITVRTTTTTAFNLTVTNTTTGRRVTPVTNIVNGDKVVIETKRQSCAKNGVEVLFDGTMPLLAVGANQLRFDMTEASAVCQVEVRWRQRYF